MSDASEEIIRSLRESTGTDFEKAVCRAFDFLGLDSKWVGSEEAEPDVLSSSIRAKIPFRVVCECCAAYDTNQVGSEKVGQIRSNGPKHKGDAEFIYLVVVGRPRFSRNAIKNSEPDVCLLLAEDLILLIKHHDTFNFWNEDLERIFMAIGLASDAVQNLIASYRLRFEKKLVMYALICLSAEKFVREQGSQSLSISRDFLIATTRAYGEALGIGIFSFDEIMNGLIFLSSPIANILSLKNDEVILYGTSFERTLSRIKIIGPRLQERYINALSRLEKALKQARAIWG